MFRFGLIQIMNVIWGKNKLERKNDRNRTEPVEAGARDGWVGAITARTLFRECFRHLWAVIDGENEDLTPISFWR
jgi:hypothetical protein